MNTKDAYEYKKFFLFFLVVVGEGGGGGTHIATKRDSKYRLRVNLLHIAL